MWIFSRNVPDLPGTNGKFNGACVDSGAQRAVVGKKQALRYIEESDVTIGVLKRSVSRRYKFADRSNQGIGALQVNIPVKEDYVICIAAVVIDLDVPLFIGLHTLTHLNAILDFSANTMTTSSGTWRLLLRRKIGHVYVERAIMVYYTKAELYKCSSTFLSVHRKATQRVPSSKPQLRRHQYEKETYSYKQYVWHFSATSSCTSSVLGVIAYGGLRIEPICCSRPDVDCVWCDSPCCWKRYPNFRGYLPQLTVCSKHLGSTFVNLSSVILWLPP